MNKHYDFKILPELGWAILTALVVVFGEALLLFDESVMSDPAAWGVALLGAAARATGAALLNTFRKEVTG